MNNLPTQFTSCHSLGRSGPQVFLFVFIFLSPYPAFISSLLSSPKVGRRLKRNRFRASATRVTAPSESISIQSDSPTRLYRYTHTHTHTHTGSSPTLIGPAGQVANHHRGSIDRRRRASSSMQLRATISGPSVNRQQKLPTPRSILLNRTSLLIKGDCAPLRPSSFSADQPPLGRVALSAASK